MSTGGKQRRRPRDLSMANAVRQFEPEQTVDLFDYRAPAPEGGILPAVLRGIFNPIDQKLDDVVKRFGWDVAGEYIVAPCTDCEHGHPRYDPCFGPERGPKGNLLFLREDGSRS